MNTNKPLFIFLWLPQIGAELAMRKKPELCRQPLAIYEEKNNKKVLKFLNLLAINKGLKEGGNLQDAFSICHNLITVKRNIQDEIQFIKALANWANRFTPRIKIKKTSELILDIRSCTKIFNGEKNLLNIINSDLEKMDITAFLGLSNTPGTAQALAKLSALKEDNIVTSRKKCTILKNMPIEVLEIGNKNIEELKYLGIKTLEDLTRTPKKMLSHRFGVKMTKKINKFVGSEPDIISSYKRDIKFYDFINIVEPIQTEEEIIKIIRKLICSLLTKLNKRNYVTQHLKLVFKSTNKDKQYIELQNNHNSYNPEIYILLFKFHIKGLKKIFDVSSIEVIAEKAFFLFPEQYSEDNIYNKKISSHLKLISEQRYKDFISHVGLKLGSDCMIYLYQNTSHIPEKSIQIINAAYASPSKNWTCPKSPRPAMIFKPEPIEIIKTSNLKRIPISFNWQKKTYEISCSFGPERIAPEWWLDDPNWRSGIRDYWQIEATCGRRLWLFEAKGQDLKGGWFIQGDFC